MPFGKEKDKDGIRSMNFLSIHSKSYDKARTKIPWQNKWHKIFRDYSDAHRVECTCKEEEISDQDQKEILFPTQSKYEGSWSVLGIGGYGVYTFPNGVLYEGAFRDGMFHGAGKMRYPAGVNTKGLFVEGIVIQVKISFVDGLEYSTENWSYCRPPDRRFCIEYDHFLQPHDLSYLTNEQPTRYIPKGYYDTGDGFFDSVTRIVKDYSDLTKIVRAPKWLLINPHDYCIQVHSTRDRLLNVPSEARKSS